MQQTIFEDAEFLEKRVGQAEMESTFAARISRLPGLLFMSLLAILTALPQIAVVSYAASSPETRAVIFQHPMIAVELALAAAFWGLLVIWPLCRIMSAVCSVRIAEISGKSVQVVDRTPFSNVHWSLPIWAYDGIAHHARTSLSGVRHELVLVHGDRRRNIVLAAAQTIGHAELREYCRLLDLPEVPPSRIYGFGRPRPGNENVTPPGDAVTA